MSWQDELRRLDDELSTGRLSEADYRRRRDALVAEAEAEQAAEAKRAAEERAAPAQSGPEESGPEESGPEESGPDAATPEPAAPAEAAADAPRIEPAAESPKAEPPTADPPKAPEPPPVPAEQTTVIDPPTTLTERIDPGIGETQYIGRADGDRTQVIGSGRPIGAGQAPPWGAGRQPAQEPNSGWMMQGPDVFGGSRVKQHANRTVPALIAAMVVLVIAAVGVSYLIWGGDDESSDAAPATVTEAPPAPQAPADPLAPADLGDGARSATLSFAAVSGLRLPPEEFGAFTQGGAGDTRLLLSTFPEGSATVLVTRTTADPIAVRDALTAAQAPLGWIPRTPQAGVFAFDQPGPPIALKAFYAGDEFVVRIEMLGTDPGAINTKFTDVLNRELRTHPARP